MPFNANDRLGPYEILAPLGAGLVRTLLKEAAAAPESVMTNWLAAAKK